MSFFSIAIAIAAVVSALIMHGCASGRIPINQFVGIRLPSVMASSGAWLAGHKAAIPIAWVGAVLCAALAWASASRVFPAGADSPFMVAAIVVLLAAVIVGSMLAHRAALIHVSHEQDRTQRKSV
ncbi:MAG: SdpI family protein [Lacisediminihabitans sp.]